MHKLPRLLLVLALMATVTGTIPVAASAGQPGTMVDPLPDPEAPYTSQIFLPIMVKSVPAQSFQVSGQVTDINGQPLVGVTIEGSGGTQTLTDASGNYTLGAGSGEYAVAPQFEGYMFEPSMIDLNLSGSVTGQDFTAMTACTESIQNGSFETSTWWNLLEGAGYYPSFYSTSVVHSGSRSVRTGILNPADIPTGASGLESSVRTPLIALPTASTVTLRLWLFPVSGEPTASKSELIDEHGVETSAFGNAPMLYDAQYVNLLDASNNILSTLLYVRSNNNFWSLHQFDLSAYAGRTVKIEIGTFNDNSTGVTALYADDVSLTVCGSTPPPPPPPATCSNQMANSGFEYNGSWGIPYTEYPAAYSNDYAVSGSRSMRTGVPLWTYGDAYSYSDAWQNVYIPASAGANLNMWMYARSQEPTAYGAESAVPEDAPPVEKGPAVVDPDVLDIDPEAQLPAEGTVWNDEALSPQDIDQQYVLILNPYTGVILETLLWWGPRNAAGWIYRSWDLSEYAGRTIRIQFGTFNNGNYYRSVMYVDEVVLDTCGGTPPPPPPPTCTERIGNGGFEYNSSWYVPYTNFTAGYSTWLSRTGLRSMRTGIVYWYHNRYSYSDFRQTVTIPSSYSTATLRYYAYQMSGAGYGKSVDETAALREGTNVLDEASAPYSDTQYLLVLNSAGHWIDTLMWKYSTNAPYWQQYVYNLNRYIGQTISLQWGTYNNGWDGVTSMYVDDVSLQACP